MWLVTDIALYPLTHHIEGEKIEMKAGRLCQQSHVCTVAADPQVYLEEPNAGPSILRSEEHACEDAPSPVLQMTVKNIMAFQSKRVNEKQILGTEGSFLGIGL